MKWTPICSRHCDRAVVSSGIGVMWASFRAGGKMVNLSFLRIGGSPLIPQCPPIVSRSPGHPTQRVCRPAGVPKNFRKNSPSHVTCSQGSVRRSDYIVGGWFPCPHTVGNAASGWLFRMLATGVPAGVTTTLAAVVLCPGPERARAIHAIGSLGEVPAGSDGPGERPRLRAPCSLATVFGQTLPRASRFGCLLRVVPAGVTMTLAAVVLCLGPERARTIHAIGSLGEVPAGSDGPGE